MSNFLVTLFSLLFLLLSFPSRAADLSPSEKSIIHYLETQKQAQLQELAKLVEVNSGTANTSGVRQVGELLRPQFEALGFKTRWVEEPAGLHRAGTLIAEKTGGKGKKLLLIGHLDTVFPANTAFQHFTRQEKTATGPGVIDDKGGDLVILYALKAMQAAHALYGTRITVVLTGDEEDSGKPTSISRKPLLDAAQGCAVALDFEWALARDTATVARRGISNWQLQVQGKEGHSSEIFQAASGAGANYELARILDTLRKELSGEQYLSLSPGLIAGGSQLDYDKETSQARIFGKGNVIAQTAFAKGDLRFLTAEQKKKAEEKMREIVSASLPGTSSSIQFQDGIPAMSPSEANLALLQQYSQVSEDLGYGEVKALDPGSRGAGDISHVAALVPAKLAGLGPVGSGAHSAQETLDLDSLSLQTQRAAILIYRLTH